MVTKSSIAASVTLRRALAAAGAVAVLGALAGPIVDGGGTLLLRRLFDAVTNGSTYAVVAIALVVIFKGTTLLNFAQANMAMFGAYLAWWFQRAGLPVWLAVGAAILASALGGAGVERTLVRRFNSSDALPVVLVTFGLAAILEAFAGHIWGLEFHSFQSPFPTGPHDAFVIGGASLRFETIGTFLTLLAMVGGLYVLLNRTRIGLAFRAVSSNVESSQLVGIHTGRTVQFCWALAAAMGTLGASLVANDTNLEPAFMAKLVIFAFAAAALGGLDSIGGAVLGAFVIALIQSIGVGYAQLLPGLGWMKSNFALVVAFAVILVVLVVKPSGFFGTRRVERV